MNSCEIKMHIERCGNATRSFTCLQPRRSSSMKKWCGFT